MKLPKIKIPRLPFPSIPKPKVIASTESVSDAAGKKRGKRSFAIFERFKEIPFPWAKALAKKKTILTLEIGDEWLKMVAVEENRQARRILDIAAEPIRGANDLEVSLKITAFLKALNFQPSAVVVSHPTHNLTVRILNLPSLDPKEIADIVELQAVKQTPHAREEITAGFSILESDHAGYSRVLVAISHRDLALRYCRILEISGLRAQRITLSLEGSWNWLNATADLGKQEAGEALLLMDLDIASTDLLVLSQGKPVFTRSLDFGLRNLAAGGASMESEFVKEVQRSLELGEADLKDKKIGRIFLTGGTGVQAPGGAALEGEGGDPLKNFGALLSREINLPSEVLPPFSEAVKRQMARPENPLCTASEVSFVTVLGLALAGESTGINLTPAEIQVRKGLEDRARDLAVMGTLLLALVSLLSLVSFGKVYKKSSYLEHLKKDYDGIHRQSEDVEKLVAKMKLASEQMAAGGGFLDVLQDISEVMPGNITLTGFQYNRQDKTATLRGISTEMSSVFQFLTTLEAVPHLESVKTRSVTKRKLEDREVAEFEMVANIQDVAPPPAEPVPEVETLKPAEEVPSPAPSTPEPTKEEEDAGKANPA